MLKRERDCLDTLLGNDPVLFSKKVYFEVGIGAGLKNARLISTASRLFCCHATPMGCQVTVIWFEDVECFTTGKKMGMPYVQLLGAASRILITFKSKDVRNPFTEVCLKDIAR